MDFDLLLDVLLGKREIFHIIECSVCGFDEIYYSDPRTKKQTGRACKNCSFVETFEFNMELS